jgi:putative transcriptional regulator
MESRLREILDERGIKYIYIAKKIGVRQATMSDLVAGSTPSLKNAYRIAKELDLYIEDVWYENVKNSEPSR